ncbi:MAG: MGMT family protein [Anaerolineaceae bacterium]|nr:MGMT family protein [Anaerolineaceae bacterium]
MPPTLPDPGAFNARVWEIVRQIPSGKVCSYGQIAAMIPAPEGVAAQDYEAYKARWVGYAMADSPPGVPWQRVINAQGKISLNKSPLQRQQRQLLEAEGVLFDSRDRVDMAQYAWDGPPAGWLLERGLLPPQPRSRQPGLFG